MASVLIYVLRRDLRLADNPIFHDIAKSFQQSHRPYTHVLPIYVVPAQQIEVSGFLASGQSSPYPEARSPVANLWRCGPNRAKFLAESVWSLKQLLEDVGSGLVIRPGMVGDVVGKLLDDYAKQGSKNQVYQVWMTCEEGSEEKDEERAARDAAAKHGKEFKLWTDEKYYVHDDDMPLQDIRKLPDVFTAYKKMVEPLREAPRPPVPRPDRLPPLPEYVPGDDRFVTPTSEQDFIDRLSKPVKDPGFQNLRQPQWPSGAESAHPFRGGERAAHERVRHYIGSGSATTYKDTRNGLLGADFSTKFSAWLALGCISARQIHEYLVHFEEGSTPLGSGVHGYGEGENKGTGWVRFELLWRDYFRLCTRKYGTRLFKASGFKRDKSYRWKGLGQGKDDEVVKQVRRIFEGTTGLGLIDASQRELWLTGYTNNRVRQNVASFLAKHLEIDWRIGAEWYEHCLVDYDVSSNWGNWQYGAGVGNDPREARLFNPVKQAYDYDSKGEYVKTWVPELRDVDDPDWVFQAWKMSDGAKDKYGLKDAEMAERPLKKIDFRPRKGGGGGDRHPRGGKGRGRGRGRGA